MVLLYILILFLPLVGATTSFAVHGFSSLRFSWRVIPLFCTLCVIFSAVLASIGLVYKTAYPSSGVVFNFFSFISVGGFESNFSILLDTLTAVMFFVVTFISAIVHVYSLGYMYDDPHQERFFMYISMFTFAMLVLIAGSDMLQIFLGWEGVGLFSYLLIGFWFEKESANNASYKAFIVNRVGDLFFILGMAVLFSSIGSLQIEEITSPWALHTMFNKTSFVLLGHEWNAVTLASLFLFLGAMGKSAQFFLHVWLPDAMEGPTPVSALIHAATMVTAGVFLLARLSPLFDLAYEIKPIRR